MPVRSLSQHSFFDPQFVMPACLVEGSVPWLLSRERSRLLPGWLFVGWRGEKQRGRNAWPAPVLMTICLLRWSEEGLSRLGAVRRARTDLVWRAAMGLRCDVEPPSERTLRDFEAFLSSPHPEVGLPRVLLVHEHIVRTCLQEGVAGQDALWATDSTPMWCYGAVLDTIRLLGDGLRQLARRWARATRRSFEEVASEWDFPHLLAKSTKGAFSVDWRDKEARAAVTTQLAEHVVEAVTCVRRNLSQSRRGFRRGLLKLCRNLAGVVESDLESDESGQLRVARRVARDRLISITDPEARHGRKSKSRLFNGFKLHVVGDLVSGLIASVCVTPGNHHDSGPTHRLIRRARTLAVKMTTLLGDTAYGATILRKHVQETIGVKLVAPPVEGRQPDNGKPRKEDFAIDFGTGIVTCPQGQASSEYTITKNSEYGLPSPIYRWTKEVCGSCPLRLACVAKNEKRRRLILHPLEKELREHRGEWAEEETRALYRRRGEFERLINQMTRHGGRKARAWGLRAANRQAHLIATCANLHLLAKKLAHDQAEMAA